MFDSLLKDTIFPNLVAAGLFGCLFAASLTVMITFWNLTVDALYKYRTYQRSKVTFAERLCIGIEMTSSGTAFIAGLNLVGILFNHDTVRGYQLSWVNFIILALVVLLLSVGYWLHIQAAIEARGRNRFVWRTCINILAGGFLSTLLTAITYLTPLNS